MQTAHDLDLAIRDSVQLENCKTEGELNYAVRNIEARHAVEGISPTAKALWEQEKHHHIVRIYSVAAA